MCEFHLCRFELGKVYKWSRFISIVIRLYDGEIGPLWMVIKQSCFVGFYVPVYSKKKFNWQKENDKETIRYTGKM
jgi:hypothetical protein